MTDAVQHLEAAMETACQRVNEIFATAAPKPKLIDELNALLVTAKSIRERHAHELANTKTHVGDGKFWSMDIDMNGAIEAVEEAIRLYETAEIRCIR